MPRITKGLGQQFTVKSVDKNFDTDTFINILKRREEIIYQTSVSPSAANIGYISGNAVTSENNLSIADRSTFLTANRAQEIAYTSISSTDTFAISTENFIVTDVFADKTNTISPLPLFYKHTLSTTHIPRDSNNDILSTYKLLTVEILDIDSQVIRVPQYKLDATKGIVYLNILSDYSSVNDFTAYYVKYVVRNNNGDVLTYTDLLDPAVVYTLATFDDLTATLTIKQDGRKVYLIEETVDGYEVTLPTSASYAYQPLSTARIEILPPVPSNSSEAWNVRITNGKFFANVNSTLYKYHIAEFLTQSFNPETPIKLSQRETSTILNPTIIKLDQNNIKQDSLLDLWVSIEVDDADGKAKAAYTTDASLAGTLAQNGKPYVVWSNSNRTGIKSIDHLSGFVDIDGLLLGSDWEITSTYYYEEKTYQYTLVNFNPISNNNVLSTRTAFFVDPDTIISAKDQTVFYLTVDDTGKVTDSNWTEALGGLWDPDTNLLATGKTLYYETLPDFLTTGIEFVGSGHYVDPASLSYFVPEYTVESESTGGAILILGDVTVSEAADPLNLGRLDSRKRGGGILETQEELIRASYPEIDWHWDMGYWDGTPYPGNASYMVEVPVDVLQDAGGTFTQTEVTDIINRHTAAGVYAVAKAYGVDILVTGLQVLASGLIIDWGSSEF